ncbi:hypothetical protein AB7M38_005146 [Bradyrhizobium diazoefficiens]
MFDSRRSGGIGEGGHLGVVVDGDGIPDLGEQPEQARARAMAFVEHGGITEHGFQHGCDIGVAGSLAARQGACIPAQQRQVFSDKL